MNCRSRALAAFDVPQSDGVGGGKERSRGVGVVSGELFEGNDNNKGAGGEFGRRSRLAVEKNPPVSETEAGTQFRVCRFENLGIIDSIFRYKVYQSKALNN